MKLSKTALILLVVGIFVVIFAGLGVAYSQQGNEQRRLTEELDLAQLRLQKFPASQLASQREELENRLAQAESQLEKAKTDLIHLIESIEASNTLYDIAETCSVEITEIRSFAQTHLGVGGIPCSALPITVQVEGEVLNLIDFIYRWTSEYPTGTVKSVEINAPEKSDEETEEEQAKPSAIISLIIYTYEGDSHD